MKENQNHVPTMYESNPAVAALNKVPGFDPLKFLRRVISPKTKEEVLRLDLPYKKLWFRLAHPKGRIRVNALRVTEQLAIYEAQVYLDLNDGVPVANFTSQYTKENAPGGLYIQAAQQEAINEALTDAGFGLQFADVEKREDGMLFGSETPLRGNPVPANSVPASLAAAESLPETVTAVPAEKEIPGPAVQKAVSTVSKENPATPVVQDKKPMTAAANSRPVTPIQEEKLPIAPAAQGETLPVASMAQAEQLPVTPTTQTETLPVAPMAQMEQLPVAPTVQAETLPVPPAVQQTVAAKKKEEEHLPIPGPAMVQKAGMEKPAEAAAKAEIQVQAPIQPSPKAEQLPETQQAAQILYMNPSAEKESAEATAPMAEEQTAETSAPKYTQDMPIEEIVKRMTYDEAMNVVVDEGTCKGWTVGEVAKRRPPSLKFYLYGGYHGGNILKAASKIMLDALAEKKAG